MEENVARHLIRILVVILSSPFTSTNAIKSPVIEVIGGIGPYQFNQVLTYRCSVSDVSEQPEFKWNCLNVIHRQKNFTKNGYSSSEIQIVLSEEVVLYNCLCSANYGQNTKTAITENVLFKTKPLIQYQAKRDFTAKAGLPVTVTVGFYAYPKNVGSLVTKTSHDKLASNETIAIHENSSITFQWNNYTLTSYGSTVSWRIDNFNETDYGQYRMKIGNNEGLTEFEFSISKDGAPSEPFNVSVVDVSSGSFLVSFDPGYDGGFQQHFVIEYRQRKQVSSVNNIVRFRNIPVRISNLRWSTEYLFVLYAENEKGQSIYSNIEPISVLTKDPGQGTHKISDSIYGIVGICIVVLITGVVAIVMRVRQTLSSAEEPPIAHSTSTINTQRGLYDDGAVFDRNRGLPSAETVDHIQRRPRRLLRNDQDEIQQPPPLRPRNPAGQAIAQSPRQRRSATMPPLPLNYPKIEIRKSETFTPKQRRQRTNYSQIRFDRNILDPTGDRQGEECSENEYGTVYVESDTLPPPCAYMEAPTLPMRKPMKK